MATGRQTSYRRANYRQNHGSQAYIYGNTVRQTETVPAREHRRKEQEQPRRVSSQVRKNRNQAMHMSAGYVIFLAVAAVVALFVCVQYLSLQSERTGRSGRITALQQEITDLKEENTTRLNSALDTINLEEVREKATKELGMTPAKEGQIITYKDPAADYMKQYEDIPKSGVIAQSDKADK